MASTLIEAVVQAAVQTPLLGDSSSSAKEKEKFILRHATLSDMPILGEHCTNAYWNSPINQYLAPRAPKYREDLVRICRQDIRQRFLSANNLSLVACRASDPSMPVAYGQFRRLGNDAGAKEFVTQEGIWTRIWVNFVLAWFFWAWDIVDKRMWPDRACDPVAVREFKSWSVKTKEKYWGKKEFPERQNRWYAEGLVVDPKFQGLGIGKMLMEEVKGRAQRERVIFGLTASPHGEFLYRRLGFVMLGDFYRRVANDVGGGVMIWYPEGWEGKRDGD